MEPFRRNNDNGMINYDVLNSKHTYYYRVDMLNGIAISCECRNGQIGTRNQTCFHKRTAEREEAKLLASFASPVEPVVSPSLATTGALSSSNRTFNLLR